MFSSQLHQPKTWSGSSLDGEENYLQPYGPRLEIDSKAGLYVVHKTFQSHVIPAAYSGLFFLSNIVIQNSGLSCAVRRL